MAPTTEEPVSAVTPEHVRHFETFGFVVIRQMFSPEEIAGLAEAFTGVLERAAAETGYDGTERVIVLPFIEGDPRLYQLLDDERVHDVLAATIGDDCLWWGGDGNFYVGNTGWHSDGGIPEYKSVKMAFYLDPVGSGSGCLSVIPGSHQRPFHDQLRRAVADGTLAPGSPDWPGRFDLVSEPGDAVLFQHSLWHSSWGGRAGRRMAAMNYDPNPEPGYQSAFVEGRVGRQEHLKEGYRYYSDTLMDSVSPRGRRRLQYLIDRGYCAKEKKPMAGPVYVMGARSSGKTMFSRALLRGSRDGAEQ